MVEGRLQTRSWESEGQKKYRTEIVADRVQFGPRSGGGGGGAPFAREHKGGGKEVDSKKESDTIEYPAEEINPDDIPF